jgi:hypothetical protein
MSEEIEGPIQYGQNQYRLPDLLQENISLSEFVGKSMELEDDFSEAFDQYQKEQTADNHEVMVNARSRYLEYVIAGIDRHSESRVSIDIRAYNGITTQWISEHWFNMVHRVDFDSLQGRSTDLPWACAMEIYPLFRTGYAIDKSLHVGPARFLPSQVLYSLLLASMFTYCNTAIRSRRPSDPTSCARSNRRASKHYQIDASGISRSR